MSSFHRGDFDRMRRNLTVALLEAESMEPRVAVAFSRQDVPAEFMANMTLVRLLLERADALARTALDRTLAAHYDVYADATYSDRALAESA